MSKYYMNNDMTRACMTMRRCRARSYVAALRSARLRREVGVPAPAPKDKPELWTCSDMLST